MFAKQGVALNLNERVCLKTPENIFSLIYGINLLFTFNIEISCVLL